MRPDETRSPRKEAPEPRALACYALSFALVFILIELRRSVRSSFWSTTQAAEWLGLAGGFVFYLAALAGISVALFAVARGFTTARWHGLLTVGATTVSALLLLGLLWLPCRTLGYADTVLGVGLIGLISAGGMAACVRGKNPGPFALAWSLLLLCASASALVAAHRLMLHIDARATLAGNIIPGSAIGAGVLISLTALVPALRAYRFPMFCVAGCACAVASWVLPADPPQSSSVTPSNNPNVLLITSDALRADYLSVYGGDTPTPHLETLAARGVLFENAYSLAPWTIPSVFGLLSSSYPPGLPYGESFEAWSAAYTDYRFPEDIPTLAEKLQADGYATAAYIGNPVLGTGSGCLRGFDERVVWTCQPPVLQGPLTHVPHLQLAAQHVLPALVEKRPVPSSRLITDFAAAFLKRRQAAPFFLWLHYMDPHDPYDPPERYRTGDGPWEVFGPTSPYWNSPRLQEDATIAVPEEQRKYVESLYRGEIRYVDECTGRVLERLDKAGLAEKTFIAFSADHGEEFWDHGRYNHGQSLFNELIHVPLIFAGPGIQAASFGSPFSAIDLMPTLNGALGRDPEVKWRGRNWAPVLRGEQAPKVEVVFAQATNRYAWPDPWKAAIREEYKLILRRPEHAPELYDMKQDPAEMSNVAAEKGNITELLHGDLMGWLSSYESVLRSDEAKEDGADGDSEKALRETLESLGYL